MQISRMVKKKKKDSIEDSYRKVLFLQICLKDSYKIKIQNLGCYVSKSILIVSALERGGIAV